jgi:hypothetical protein
MRLWICGEGKEKTESGVVWELLGVFDSEEKAVAACTMPNHFVGPAELNQRLPDESSTWPGCYYPLAESVSAE